MEEYGIIGDKVVDLDVEICKNLRRSGEKGGEILRRLKTQFAKSRQCLLVRESIRECRQADGEFRKFFEERITLGVRAGGVFKRERADAQMQFAHTLKERKVLNVLRFDFIRQTVVVGTFALLWLLVGGGGERNMLRYDFHHLFLHLLHLFVSQGLKSEVEILLQLVLHEVVAVVNLRDYVSIYNQIARQLQKVKSADGIVALRFRRFKPLLYLFSEFVVHNELAFGCHKITLSIIADKRRKMCIFAVL